MVPQEYGVAAQDKVEIGVKIAYAMLSKLRRDLLAGMDTVSHEQALRPRLQPCAQDCSLVPETAALLHTAVAYGSQERVHQLDHRLADDVRSPLRHVRTRLYFTSESHIHSAFNVLRWGHQYARAPDGLPCLSIFSDEARRSPTCLACNPVYPACNPVYPTCSPYCHLTRPARNPTRAVSTHPQLRAPDLQPRVPQGARNVRRVVARLPDPAALPCALPHGRG